MSNRKKWIHSDYLNLHLFMSYQMYCILIAQKTHILCVCPLNSSFGIIIICCLTIIACILNILKTNSFFSIPYVINLFLKEVYLLRIYNNVNKSSVHFYNRLIREFSLQLYFCCHSSYTY